MSEVQIAIIDQEDTQITLAVPGVQGAAGAAGATGATGAAGFAGPQAVPGSIGIAGRINFGVGPIVPAGSTFYPIFAQLFDPIHLLSGSFM